jgi:hypothetical protein
MKDMEQHLLKLRADAEECSILVSGQPIHRGETYLLGWRNTWTCSQRKLRAQFQRKVPVTPANCRNQSAPSKPGLARMLLSWHLLELGRKAVVRE